MRIIWSDNRNSGLVDSFPITEKPVFSFVYEYININSEVQEYAPKERANYLELTNIPEDIIVEEYINRVLSAAQLVEAIAFYNTYPRDPAVLPNYNSTTHKLLEDGTEVIDGLTYKSYTVVSLTQQEVAENFKAQVPQTITPRQIRMQLTNSGLRNTVEDIINSSTDFALKDWWEYSLEYDRNNDILLAFSNQLGLTEEQVDTMFIEASKL